MATSSPVTLTVRFRFTVPPPTRSHNVEISGNTIDHDGPIGLATIKDVAITGNTITGNGSLNPAASGDAIWIWRRSGDGGECREH